MKEERELGQALVPYFDFIISINGKRLVCVCLQPRASPRQCHCHQLFMIVLVRAPVCASASVRVCARVHTCECA